MRTSAGQKIASFFVVALLGLAAAFIGCTSSQSGPAPSAAPPAASRLIPISVQTDRQLDVTALFDRDTSTALQLDAPVTLTFTFAHPVEVQSLKIFAPRQLSVMGQSLHAEGRWVPAPQAPAGKQTNLSVTITPTADGAGLAELELWGVGAGSAPRDGDALAAASAGGASLPFDNAFVVASASGNATLQPGANANSCASFSFQTSLPLASARRAFLAYEAAGVQRPVVLRRTLNGAMAVGGFWLGGGAASHTLSDELDPRKLTGNDSVQLCLPDEASQSVSIGSPRLVLEMDDGTNLLDRDSQARLAEAFDGHLDTSVVLDSGALSLSFDRPHALDAAYVNLASGATTAVLQSGLSPSRFSLAPGWNSLTVTSQAVGKIDLSLDQPSAPVAEVALAGSPVGAPAAGPRIVVTYPRLRWSAGKFVGEHFGDQAFVAGWAESPAGPGEVTIAGAPVGLGKGTFAAPLTRPAGVTSWQVTISARFPDGSTLTRDVFLDDDNAGEIASENGSTAGLTDEQRFGAENTSSSGSLDGSKGGKAQLGSDVSLVAPPGAVSRLTPIGITRQASEMVPRLDPGMVNVTAPRGAGYFFTPHGQTFRVPVAVTLPYDASLLPRGKTVDHIQTFFFDEKAHHWKSLPRRAVNRSGGQLVSETTHFTFMINAVIVDPNHPGPTSYNPTSIKDIKIADPSAGIDFISPPQANSTGSAHVAIPVRIPPARGAFTPAIALSYDSQTPSTWTGLGWDLNVSNVSVDTTFGAPFYDGTERYVLDGDQLVPIGSGSCVDGSIGKRFAARAEGSFDLILRCGADPASFHFERTDRSGTLFVYGVSPEARLASPRTGDIGLWHLERVIDTNGNLCRYIYEQDQKNTPGTAFDAATGQDFRQSYLSEIHYTGKASRTGAAALDASQDSESGAYAIVFQRVRSNGVLTDRPDVITSARTGFKIVTRHLLERVQVWLLSGPSNQTGIVREYRMNYELGDFGKSRIASLDVFGRGGDNGTAPFYSHRFAYTHVEPGFGSPVPWTFDSPDGAAITSTSEINVGVHAYAGISIGPLRDEGSVGLSTSFNHRSQSTEAVMVDLNGDGLPDRITANSIKFNQTAADGSHKLSSFAPPGDPLNGGTAFVGLPTLGTETGDNFNFGVQAVFGPVFANVGGSFNFSNSDSFLIDVDGDGLPDVISGGQVLFNQPRTCSGPGCSPPGQFSFGTVKPVSTATFANLSGTGDLIAADPTLNAARQAVKDQTPPNDALLEWTAPFEGTVSLDGQITWAHTPPNGPASDGVRLRLYQAHEDGTMDTPGQPVFEVFRRPAETDPTSVSIPNLNVLPHDHIYFVLSTLDDFPIGAGPQPVSLEEIVFAPTMKYTACTGDCGVLTPDDLTLVDPTNAPVFTFNTASDFKLAGAPLTSVQAAFTGTLHVSGDVDKNATTADDIRVCVQKFPLGTPVTDILCGDPASPEIASTGVGADFVGATPFAFDTPISAGDSLVFRIDTDLPVDPAAIVWSPTGAMTSVCDATGVCHTPQPSEIASTTFIADPYFRLHGRYEPVPLRPLLIPHDGVLTVDSNASAIATPVTFSVRSQGKLFLKHHAGEEATATFNVTAGEQIYFEAHAETDPGFRDWPVSVALDGEPFVVPLNVTFDQPPAGVTSSPFGGGFHGFRYGTWNGTTNDVFDATVFYHPLEGISFPGATPHDQVLNAKAQFRDPNNPVSQRGRLFSVALPRRRGTANNAGPGLAPTPAFVSQDGTVFFTQQTMNAGRVGAFVNGQQTQSAQGLFANGDPARASTGQTISGGIGINLGITSLSLQISAGSSNQTLDVRDMNGDGIIDVVADGSGARLTHLNNLGPRPVPAALQTGAPFSLQKSSDLSVSAGLGFSEPFRDVSSKGNVRGLYAMFPSSIGGGIAANLSAVDTELIDVNGDGLPDQVRLDRGTHQLFVRLNLGTSFAENEDALPGATFSAQAGFDPFAQDVAGQVGGLSPGDADESSGQGGALGVLDKLSSPDVVRRSNSATIELNAGFVFEEEFGATVNFESTLGSTSVELIDVTGDGLPDYVKKSAGDNFFTVRVNTGFGFGPEQIWPVTDWPVQKPQLKLPIGPLQALVNDIGFGGGADSIEASATNTAIPSVGFAASVTIPLSPLLTPWLILSAGGDVSPRKLTGFELTLMDIDGDGIPDHVLKVDGGDSSAVWARINQNAGANLLKHIDEPLGESFDLTYVRAGNTVDNPMNRFVMASVTEHDGVAVGPGHDITSLISYDGGREDRNERAFFGFATVQTLRPDGSTSTQHFANDTYRRKGLLLSSELRDATGALFTANVNFFDDSPALVAPALDECRAVSPFFLDPDDYCSAAWTRLLRSESRSFEGTTADVNQSRITTAQDYTYDLSTGNVIAFDDFGDVNDPAEANSAVVQYQIDNGLHAIDRPVHITVLGGPLGSGGPLLRERFAAYDGLANLIQTTINVGNGAAISDFLRDGDGNLQHYVGPSNAVGQRYTTDYVYDATTRSFIVEESDVFGYSSTADYDLGLAELIRTTDLNGNSTVRNFDADGRLATVFGPSDPLGGPATINISYSPQAVPAFALTQQKLPQPKRDGSTTLDTVIFMDGFQRAIQSRADAEVNGNLGTTVSGRLDFDSMGRVNSRGQATFSQTSKTTFVTGAARNPTAYLYDVLDRALVVNRPEGSVTTTSFGFGTSANDPVLRYRTAVTDPEGRLHVSFSDGHQLVSAVEERIDGRIPTTHYAYDPLGQLVASIDAAGNVTSLAHDLVGRTTQVTTPDSGLTEYAYDPAGNLIRRVDPNLRAAGQAVSFLYQFNRLSRIVRPVSGNIDFSYGPPGAGENAADRVTAIADEAGLENRGYGKLGELTRTRRTLVPLSPSQSPRIFETRFSYDSFGRLLQLVYPDGETISYGFDGGGLLASASSVRPATRHTPLETETYLASLRYDEFGSRVAEQLGNGVTTAYAYDPLTRRLAHTQTVTPQGNILQAISYAYDRVGNLLSENNGRPPSTNKSSGPISYSFQYDALDRLIGAQGTADAKPNLGDKFFSTFNYSDIHNMTRNVQVRQLLHGPGGTGNIDLPNDSNHDFTYLYQGAGPHRATQIGDQHLVYDLNGNTAFQCQAAIGQTCAGSTDVNGGQSVSNQQLRTYTWGEDNQLRSSADQGTNNPVRFLYDAAGQRVAKFSNGDGSHEASIGQFFTVQGEHNITKHIFAGSLRLASKTMADADEVDFLQAAVTGSAVCGGGSLPPCQTQPEPAGQLSAETYYFHPDHLGSNSWITDHVGNIHEHLEFFPYGDVWREFNIDFAPGPQPNIPSFLFTGKEFDPETGLTYFGARYYDSKLARWISNDPALLRAESHEPSDLSGYLYGGAHPLRYVDPDGRGLLDIAFVGVDIYEFYKEPSLLNGAFLAYDAVSLVLQTPSAGTVRVAAKAIKYANQAHREAEVASAARKVEEAGHAAQGEKVAQEGEKVAQEGEKVAQEGEKTVQEAAEVKPGQVASSYPKDRRVGGRREGARPTDPKGGFKEQGAFDLTPENLKRMEKGQPPIGRDGKPVELHHQGQNPTGPLDELTSTTHDTVPHSNAPSRINRRAFRGERRRYWVQRARELLGQE
jgi:RHS repeat-associated protein